VTTGSIWAAAERTNNVERKAWEKVESALQAHHYEPDLQAARVLYAALAAHRLAGQPVWPMLVAPPGSMKTDLLAALDGFPNVHLIDRVTPNTFLSGQVKEGRRPATANSSSLLHRIGPSGIIAYPDFSTVLSMNRDHRGSVLADMRRIYDGHLRKEYGTDENRKEHEWKGRITFAVATTDEVDRHYSVFQTLGERFVMIRWGRPGGVEAALKAMNQDRELGKKELREAVHALFLSLPEMDPVLTQPMQQSIASLAEFAVRGRTQIPRVGNSKEIIYVPEPEAATRLAQQLAQLTKGSAVLDGRDVANEDDYELSKRVAFDCIPTARRKILNCLISGNELSDAKLPASTQTYVLEDLGLVGLYVSRPYRHGLSRLGKELLEAAGVL
jgi:hypothetical protein